MLVLFVRKIVYLNFYLRMNIGILIDGNDVTNCKGTCFYKVTFDNLTGTL